MTADSEHKHKYEDFRDHFSRDELVRAMILLSGDQNGAEAAATEVYADDRESFGIAGDLASALSAASDESAERVRLFLGETEVEAKARLADFLGRRPLGDSRLG